MHGSDETEREKASIERANYAAQGMKARKIEASLLEAMAAVRARRSGA
jgi:hypothetical protein